MLYLTCFQFPLFVYFLKCLFRFTSVFLFVSSLALPFKFRFSHVYLVFFQVSASFFLSFPLPMHLTLFFHIIFNLFSSSPRFSSITLSSSFHFADNHVISSTSRWVVGRGSCLPGGRARALAATCIIAPYHKDQITTCHLLSKH